MTDGSRTETGFAQVSGAPLYYEVVGTGHPLVLIHEGIADSRMFDDQWGAFAAHHRVIRYDVHGSGRSGIPDIPYTDHGALYDLLRFLGVERTHLLGMSMGGGIAVDFTLAYPALVDTLLPVASAVGGYENSAEAGQQWGAINAAMTEGDLAAAVELILRMWVDGPDRTPDQVAPAVRERMREIVAHCWTLPDTDPLPLDPPAITRLGKIDAPTLIIVGDGDQPDILEQANLLHNGIAGAQRVVIPGVAHLLNMERPAEFNRLVLDFLRR